MIVELQDGDLVIPFRLDEEHARWHSLVKKKESDFPLITEVDGKCLELYSDGTFAAVER
jgi:hypothetical protein